MNKLVYGIIAGTLSLGIGSSLPIAAHAMGSSYSAQRSNSVRLIWRHTMGNYTYHNGDSGARYSEHLGVRYSANSETDHYTWITDAHEKLYNLDTHTYAIYYHVRTANDSHAGWIWRGYLSAGAASQAQPTTPSQPVNQSPVSTQPLTLADFQTTNFSPSKVDTQALTTYGHGAHPDNQYMAFAQYLLNLTIANNLTDELPDSYYQNNPDNPGNYHDSLFFISNDLGPWSIKNGSLNKETPGFMALMAAHGITDFGGGPNKYLIAYYSTEEKISTDDFILDLVASEPDLMGEKASQTPYFEDGPYMVNYKIGIATRQVSPNRVASFAIINNPFAH